MVMAVLLLFSAAIWGSDNLDNYKNGKFQNLKDHESKSLFDYLVARVKDPFKDWPNHVPLPQAPVVPDENSKDLKVHYINHSSFLVQHNDFNILTDPVFSKRVSPVSWAGPKRVMDAGIEKSKLPKIDIILISHNHYDHLDLKFLEWISKRDKPLILVGKKVGQIFSKKVNCIELGWNESKTINDIKFTFTPAQHFSGRTPFDKNETLWGAFVIESLNLKIYFAGDTGYSDHFKKVHATYGAMDLSLIPIGAYAPRSFMAYHHMDPEEALKAHRDLNSKYSLGMHWGTFQLTSEPREEPKILLEKLKLQNNIQNFYVPTNGDVYSFKNKKLIKKPNS